MKRWKIFTSPGALNDVQAGIDFYNKQRKGLGKEFYSATRKTIKEINRNPYFQIRYDNVRCLFIERFPYMIHFAIHEEDRIVIIHAILHTSLDPEEYWMVE